MQCIDIDCCNLRTIGHRSVSETLYATRLAKEMCDGCRRAVRFPVRPHPFRPPDSNLLRSDMLIGQWRIHYKTVRPHSLLGSGPPAPQVINSLVMQALVTQQ